VWCRTIQASTAAGALPCTARRCPPPRLPKRARRGVALVGNPEEVDEVASPNPNDGIGRKPESDKRRIGEIGTGSPSLRADRRTTTASVVCGYEVTLEQMLACRQTGSRVGIGHGPLALGLTALVTSKPSDTSLLTPDLRCGESRGGS
jgi:hypothetical protein